jgi:hypothetical protein
MNTTRNLLLAAVAALSLGAGAGAAMAQSQVPSSNEGAYFLQQHQAAPKILNGWAGPVQSGSSDIETPRSGFGHVLPFNGNYSVLANPG